MRKLSEDEKKFTRELVRISKFSHNVFLTNVVYGEMQDTNLFIDYDNRRVSYHFDKILYDQNQTDFADMAREFSWKMIRYHRLIEYLEKMDMLFLYQESENRRGTNEFGLVPVGNSVFEFKIHDKEAIEIILECSEKTILVNQILSDYVENDFQTEDDIRYKASNELAHYNLDAAKDTLKIASRTMYITIVIFIISTLINFWFAMQSNS